MLCSICYLILYCTNRVMVYLGSATRKVLLGAAQYLLPNTYWAMVYPHSTTIKEQLRAVHYLLHNTYWVLVYLGTVVRPGKVLFCAVQYLLPNTVLTGHGLP